MGEVHRQQVDAFIRKTQQNTVSASGAMKVS
jgi:hypothetical protein